MRSISLNQPGTRADAPRCDRTMAVDVRCAFHPVTPETAARLAALATRRAPQLSSKEISTKVYRRIAMPYSDDSPLGTGCRGGFFIPEVL